MSTHNICFHGEIRKYQQFSDKKSALSVAMDHISLRISSSGFNIITDYFCCI